MVATGVAKSATSSRRSRFRGSAVLRKSTTSVRPCWRISMPVELSERSTMMLVAYAGGRKPHPWTIYVVESVWDELEDAVRALTT